MGRSLARGAGEAGDPGCLLDALSDIFWVFVIVVAVLLLVLIGLPLLLAIVDVLLLALLTVLGVAARVVFGRPWIVEARSTAPRPVVPADGPRSDEPDTPGTSGTSGPAVPRHTWRIVGWQASGDAVDAVANALEHGKPLPPGGTPAPAAAPPPRDDRS